MVTVRRLAIIAADHHPRPIAAPRHHAMTRTIEEANPLEFGVTVTWADQLESFRRQVAVAEQYGFTTIGVGDSPIGQREVWGACAVAALGSSRCRVGPMVTNPVTRHPAVTAAAAATLQDISGGRAFVGLGRGGHGVTSLGAELVSGQRLAEYGRTVRSLMRGESAMWDGNNLHMHWSSQPVPLVVIAYGPRTAELAGEFADEVVLGLADPAAIELAKADVRRGAERAGRDPDSIQVSIVIRAAVDDTYDEALATLRGSLASAAFFALRPASVKATLPAEIVGQLEQFHAEYDRDEHLNPSGNNAKRAEALGLLPFLAQRFGICGTADDCIRQLKAIADVGVTSVNLVAVVPDAEALIARFGAEVLPGMGVTAPR
jgi:5,10-methylenetetrahydromethanopterin reductase